MEHREPRLGEAITEERDWESDGITVLTASVTLPQLAGGGVRARRFNRYYRRFLRAYLAYCEHILLPEAAESCRAAMAVSAPWETARAALDWRASHRAGEVLSIVCDARETVSGMPPFLLRRSEVWDLSTGLPMPPDEFFPAHEHCRKRLLRFARAEIARNVKNGAQYRENWRAALRRTLSTENWYLTSEGLCFFFPLCALAGASEGIVSFTMAYDAEKGPFPPPER